MPYNEAPFSVNFKPHGGYDAPLITVRAESAEELSAKLGMLSTSDVFDAVGRAQGTLAAKFEMGKQLGATTEAPHMQSTQPGPEWAGAPEQTWGQPQQPPQQQQQQQYQQPPAQQAAPQAAPAAPGDYGQQPPQQYQQQQYQAPPQQGTPGAPLILGMPAKLIDKGKWKAWADPRPMNVTDNIQEKTEDPNDPRLAQGTAKFWKFIR